mgnify:CR=1 FL=1
MRQGAFWWRRRTLAVCAASQRAGAMLEHPHNLCSHGVSSAREPYPRLLCFGTARALFLQGLHCSQVTFLKTISLFTRPRPALASWRKTKNKLGSRNFAENAVWPRLRDEGSWRGRDVARGVVGSQVGVLVQSCNDPCERLSLCRPNQVGVARCSL